MTLREDIAHQALVGDHKPFERGGDSTVTRDNGVHSAPKEDRFGMHGPRNKKLLSVTSNEDYNSRLANSNTNDKEGEENSEKTEVKLPA